MGAITVDAYSRTLIPSIYAVGDVTNRAARTPVAIREGHAFADTVFGGRPTMVDHSIIPTAVFSTPEIGVVGCTEATARALPATSMSTRRASDPCVRPCRRLRPGAHEAPRGKGE